MEVGKGEMYRHIGVLIHVYSFYGFCKGDEGRGQGFRYIYMLMLADLVRFVRTQSHFSSPSTSTGFPPKLVTLERCGNLAIEKKGLYYFF